MVACFNRGIRLRASYRLAYRSQIACIRFLQKAAERRIRQSARLTPAMIARRHGPIVPQPPDSRITPATLLCDRAVCVRSTDTNSINRFEGGRYQAGT